MGLTCPHFAWHRAGHGCAVARPIRLWPVKADWRVSIGRHPSPAHAALNAARDDWGAAHLRRLAVPLAPLTRRPDKGLGVARSKALRGETGYQGPLATLRPPNLPGRGGDQATRQGGKALSLYCVCPRAHITDNFIYLERKWGREKGIYRWMYHMQ